MRLVAIDPNTKASGYVLFEDGKPIQWNTIKAKGLDDMLHGILLMLSSSPLLDAIAIEGAYLGENANTFGLLSQLIGGVRGWAVMHQKPFYVLSTAEIDTSIGISHVGKRKQTTARFASHELGSCTEHESDAYCTGIAALGLMWTRRVEAEGE